MKMTIKIQGPQGVGKTTLAEWLAAALELSANEQVNVITVDGVPAELLPDREIVLGESCTEIEILTGEIQLSEGERGTLERYRKKLLGELNETAIVKDAIKRWIVLERKDAVLGS